MGILKIVVISVFLFIGHSVGAEPTKKQKYDGNYPTRQIRDLWQVCSIAWQVNNPQIPQPIRWDVCDCYVDVIRETLTPEKLSKLSYKQAKEVTVTLINECNEKLNKPVIAT